MGHRRISAHKRGYDAKWNKLRDEVVIERGFTCEMCAKPVVLRKTEALGNMQVAHVDHIKSIQEAPELRLDRANLRCLCESCHNRHTIYTQGFHNELASAAVLAEISKLEKGTAPALEYLAAQLQKGEVSIATRVVTDQPLNHMCLPYQDYLTQGDWIKDLLRYVKQAERTMDGADKQASANGG